MTTGFGFCPNCGTPRVAAEQRFCAGCGATLSSAAPSAPVEPMAPMAPPAPAEEAAAAAAVPPAPPAAAQPVAPPPWSVASPGTPGTPANAGAGIKVTPQMLAIGGVVLAVVVGAYLFMNMNSNSGGITFTPSTLSCSSPVTFTAAARLPASVHAGDTITIKLDGKLAGTSTVSSSAGDVTQQADGSWVTVSTTTSTQMQTLCAAGGSAGGFNILTPGTHTMQILDASGKILAQGSYTVTP
jgi:hypothetical protein